MLMETFQVIRYKYAEERKKKMEAIGERATRDLCWLINNAGFIQNQLGLSTQNTFCIMKSPALTLVQQEHEGRPKKDQTNFRPAGPRYEILGKDVHGPGDKTRMFSFRARFYFSPRSCSSFCTMKRCSGFVWILINIHFYVNFPSCFKDLIQICESSVNLKIMT